MDLDLLLSKTFTTLSYTQRVSQSAQSFAVKLIRYICITLSHLQLCSVSRFVLVPASNPTQPCLQPIDLRGTQLRVKIHVQIHASIHRVTLLLILDSSSVK